MAMYAVLRSVRAIMPASRRCFHALNQSPTATGYNCGRGSVTHENSEHKSYDLHSIATNSDLAILEPDARVSVVRR